jgi:hypothetical protein
MLSCVHLETLRQLPTYSILVRTASIRELRAHVFLGPGPVGPRPGAFSTNIQHPVCTWIYRNRDLTTYNCLSREKNRYAIISWCLFLSINAPKIKSCHLVEKSRTNVLYVDLSSIVFRFQAKIKVDLVKTKDGPGSDKKSLGPSPHPRKKIFRPGSGHARSSLALIVSEA